MATVDKVKLQIPQGTTFRYLFEYKDEDGDAIDITGYTARCQFRETVDSAADFFEATTDNGGITIDGTVGKLTLLVEPTDSTPWDVLKGVYDIEIVSPAGDVTRIVQGPVVISPEVTRD